MMMGFGFGGLGIIFMLAFWIIIIALAVWLLSNIFPTRATSNVAVPDTAPHRASAESALEILKQRYARGEISYAEYEEMRRDLEV